MAGRKILFLFNPVLGLNLEWIRIVYVGAWGLGRRGSWRSLCFLWDVDIKDDVVVKEESIVFYERNYGFAGRIEMLDVGELCWNYVRDEESTKFRN